MADQFLKRENWFAMAGSSIRKRVGEEEEAQEERDAASAPPYSQGLQTSGRMRPGGGPLPLGETPSWSSLTSISLNRDNSGDCNLGLTSSVLAASCSECCRILGE